MKIKVAVFFGGNSVEHDISIISALQAIKAIDKEKFEVIPIYLSKQNVFYAGEYLLNLSNYQNDDLFDKITRVDLINEGNKFYFLSKKGFKKQKIFFDIALPVVHGKGIEDGTLFGLFDIFNIPYVGPSIVGASVAQDKQFMKDILISHEFPLIPYYAFLIEEYSKDEETTLNMIEKMGYPVVIKPASLGSSIGINKACNREELKIQIEVAKNFDNKVVVEKMIVNLKEVNCSVIGTPIKAKASIVEEILSDKDILTFQDKYEKKASSEGMASLGRIIPARITEEEIIKVQDLALKAFKILNGTGVARIDFIIDQDSSEIYFNEINTIPGSLSYYLWDKSNLRFDKMLEELISIGRNESIKKRKLISSFKSNAIKNISSSGKLIK